MKIKLTEGQLQRLKHISEGLDNTYNTQVNVKFSVGKDFKFPNEINDINLTKMRVNFNIDVEYRSWGIKNIMLYNIKGPEAIEADVEYYNQNDDEVKTATITVKLDWENALKIENESGSNIVTIDNDAEIVLGGNNETGFFASEINLIANTL